MNVLKNPSFFRPSSRPSSPAPPSVPPRSELPAGAERPSRPLNKLSLTNFIRASPSPSPAPSPAPTTLVQDGSYLEMLSLKLSEAVTRALAQPPGPSLPNESFLGKRPIPQGRGLALGALIASELNAANGNAHLYKAVLRSLQRPLTVLSTNLSAQLPPLLTSPAFLEIPTISSPGTFPNTVQLHALSVANFCEEMLHVFDGLGLGLDVDNRGDGLKQIRDGFVSLVKRVVNPIITAVREVLVPLVEALERPNPMVLNKPVTGTRATPTIIYHPSIVSLQVLMPAYIRALTSCTHSTLSHTMLAGLLISVLWKAMVAIAHRVETKPSPALTAESLPSGKKRRGSPTTTTPPVTPPPTRFTIKLPPSRPPSPPPVVIHASAAADCKALYDLLSGLPRPSAEQESTKLASEAVVEAFEGLRTLPALLAAVKSKGDGVGDEDPETIAADLNHLTHEIPSLIALPIILRASGGPGISSVPDILGHSEDEYRKGCLSGFSRSEECAEAICQRVLDILQADDDAPLNQVVIRWLEMELAELDLED